MNRTNVVAAAALAIISAVGIGLSVGTSVNPAPGPSFASAASNSDLTYWVAEYGNDANNCALQATPCLSPQAAANQMAIATGKRVTSGDVIYLLGRVDGGVAEYYLPGGARNYAAIKPTATLDLTGWGVDNGPAVQIGLDRFAYGHVEGHDWADVLAAYPDGGGVGGGTAAQTTVATFVTALSGNWTDGGTKGAAVTTVTVSPSPSWATNLYRGNIVLFTSDPFPDGGSGLPVDAGDRITYGHGQAAAIIVSNTADTLEFLGPPSGTLTPAAGATFKVVRPGAALIPAYAATPSTQDATKVVAMGELLGPTNTTAAWELRYLEIRQLTSAQGVSISGAVNDRVTLCVFPGGSSTGAAAVLASSITGGSIFLSSLAFGTGASPTSAPIVSLSGPLTNTLSSLSFVTTSFAGAISFANPISGSISNTVIAMRGAMSAGSMISFSGGNNTLSTTTFRSEAGISGTLSQYVSIGAAAQVSSFSAMCDAAVSGLPATGFTNRNNSLVRVSTTCSLTGFLGDFTTTQGSDAQWRYSMMDGTGGVNIVKTIHGADGCVVER